MLMSLILTLPMTNWLYKKCARIRGIDTEVTPTAEMVTDSQGLTAAGQSDDQEGGTEK